MPLFRARPSLFAVVLSAASLGLSFPARAADLLRLCTSDRPLPPYSLPDGSGTLQRSVEAAARQLGLRLVRQTAPRARCLQDSRSGATDAVIGAFREDRLAWLAYPMLHGRPDPARAMAQMRFVVIRRQGSAANWDGQRFSGLGGQPVGLVRGYVLVRDLAALADGVDEQAGNGEQLLSKLERGRVGLALLQDDQARALLAQAPPGRFELLPHPFEELTLYLMLSHDFERRHPGVSERLWQLVAARPHGAASEPATRQR